MTAISALKNTDYADCIYNSNIKLPGDHVMLQAKLDMSKMYRQDAWLWLREQNLLCEGFPQEEVKRLEVCWMSYAVAQSAVSYRLC